MACHRIDRNHALRSRQALTQNGTLHLGHIARIRFKRRLYPHLQVDIRRFRRAVDHCVLPKVILESFYKSLILRGWNTLKIVSYGIVARHVRHILG